MATKQELKDCARLWDDLPRRGSGSQTEFIRGIIGFNKPIGFAETRARDWKDLDLFVKREFIEINCGR